MRKLFFVFLLACLYGASLSINAQNNKSIVGDWKYNVSQAPYGYDKGVISLKESEKVLTGDVTFDLGYKANLQSVTLKNDTLRAGVYVDSEYVNIISLVKGNKLEGTVDSSIGIMNLTAEKIKKE